MSPEERTKIRELLSSFTEEVRTANRKVNLFELYNLKTFDEVFRFLNDIASKRIPNKASKDLFAYLGELNGNPKKEEYTRYLCGVAYGEFYNRGYRINIR